jgi:hypothetical protein
MRPLKIIGLILGIGSAVYVLFVLSVVVSPGVNNYFSRTEFDSDKWKSWKMTEDKMTLRWDMVHDLQQQHELDGMTEDQVIELLGQPASKDEIEWTYDLGMARRGIDSGILSLTFENGKVKGHYVRTG